MACTRENVSKEREKGRRREKSVLIAPNEHGATGRTLTHCPQSIIQVLLRPWPKKGEEEDQQCGTDGSRAANVGEGKSHTCSEEEKGGIEGEPPPKEERERGKAHSTHLMRAERFLPPSSSSPLIPPTPLLGERERGNKSQLFPVVGSPPPPPQCMCVHARPFLLLSLSPQTTTKSLLKGEIQQRNTTFHQKSPAPLTYGGNLYFFVKYRVVF